VSSSQLQGIVFWSTWKERSYTINTICASSKVFYLLLSC
jgi:hypothetical protein